MDKVNYRVGSLLINVDGEKEIFLLIKLYTISRALMGLSESVTFPAITSMLAQWAPLQVGTSRSHKWLLTSTFSMILIIVE